MQVLLLLLLAAKPDPKLAGSWGIGGEVLFVLSADGRGSSDGDPIEWTADGKVLSITDEDGETERIPYQLEGDKLIITMNGIPIPLERSGAAKMERTQAPPAQSDQLSQLLLSSAWCSFSYSSASGTTRTTRVVFSADGTWSLGGNRETSWSGQNGSYVGQSGSAANGRWLVKNGQLSMSNPPETPELEPVALTVARNSSGYPIITADGVEYSMCR